MRVSLVRYVIAITIAACVTLRADSASSEVRYFYGCGHLSTNFLCPGSDGPGRHFRLRFDTENPVQKMAVYTERSGITGSASDFSFVWGQRKSELGLIIPDFSVGFRKNADTPLLFTSYTAGTLFNPPGSAPGAYNGSIILRASGVPRAAQDDPLLPTCTLRLFFTWRDGNEIKRMERDIPGYLCTFVSP